MLYSEAQEYDCGIFAVSGKEVQEGSPFVFGPRKQEV